VVRACILAAGCSPDSNVVSFVVDPPAGAPPPAAANLHVGVTTGLVESPNFTKITLPNVGVITDALGGTWSLAPKDPLIEGGIEFVVIHNGAGGLGAALYLCYHNHIVGQSSVGNWYDWNGKFFQNVGTAIPAGC